MKLWDLKQAYARISRAKVTSCIKSIYKQSLCKDNLDINLEPQGAKKWH